MSKELVIVFCRAPIKGQVKKRLAKDLGGDAAFKIYEKILQRTLTEVERTGYPYKIYYSGVDGSYFKKHSRPLALEKQKEADLGEAMFDAIEREKANGFDRLILIGSDIPELESGDISEAIKQLDENDLVFGPAMDGGYYLIGLKENRVDLFSDIPWGEDRVLESSLRKASDLRLKEALIKERRDLDTIEDLKYFPELLKLASG